MQLAVCLRKRLTEEGISERASDLIVSSRKEDTLSTYSSAWNKWVSWCVEQNVDTFRCNVNWILNFITFLFESGYEYRTILHLGQQFELYITTLRENLLESTYRLVLLLQVCSIKDYLSLDITLCEMFSWYWISCRKNFQTIVICQINLKVVCCWLCCQHPG